jgi:hypothetical protein
VPLPVIPRSGAINWTLSEQRLSELTPELEKPHDISFSSELRKRLVGPEWAWRKNPLLDVNEWRKNSSVEVANL